jgi:hypothetical protein
MSNDVLQLPTDFMRTKAQNILGDNTSLTDITNTYIQQMRQHHESLPIAMQSPFQEFISTMQEHLSTGLGVHQQIGKLLHQAADAGNETDRGISQGF